MESGFSSRDKRPGNKDEGSREKTVFDPEEYSLRKRLPFKWSRRKNDVYVTRKTHFAAQLERCCKLLDSCEKEIYIHGLGAAVSRAIHLALQVKQKYHGSIEVDVHTATEKLMDDLLPEVDNVGPETRMRNSSAVHIRIYRPNNPVGL